MTLRTDLGRSETSQGLHMEWSTRLGGGGSDVKKRDNTSLAMDTLSGWAILEITHWLGVGPTY